MNIELNKLPKYIMGTIIVFFALKYVLHDKLKNVEIGLISIIMMLVFASVEYAAYVLSIPKESPSCNSYCSIKEPMENVAQETFNKNFIVKSDSISREGDGTYTIKMPQNKQIEQTGSRAQDGVLKTEVQYNYTDYNMLPPNLNEGSFESGYSFLPPSQWYPQPPHPPVCVAEKQCPVCPVLTNREYADLKEWDDTRRVHQPDGINTDYIKEKLNSGR